MNANKTKTSARRMAGRHTSLLLLCAVLAVLGISGAAKAARSRGLNITVSPNRQTLPDDADDKRPNKAAPQSLKHLKVPEPPNLDEFVKNRAAAITLGKALFWDQQVGSDGVQACASCHFHAGADARTKNTVNPGSDGLFKAGNGPNTTRTAADFPLHKLSVTNDRLSAVLRDTNDIVGSQGVFDGTFLSINPGNAKETGKPISDPTYHVGLVNTRRVTGRQAPSVINAAFNYNNFWDGRANFVFNGANPFGDADQSARVYVNFPGATATAPWSMAAKAVHITNASLASQAVGPPGSDVEMSLARRTFPDIGKKLLQLRPLGSQIVDPTDSVLGALSRVSKAAPTRPGLGTTYIELIMAAFQDKYWNSTTQMVSIDATGAKIIKKSGLGVATNYSQMEANFSLFFGLAVQMYESTLISDDTPFDRFQEGDSTAMSTSAQQGLNLFMTPSDPAFAGGSCFSCHFGAEFTKATVSNVGSISFLGDLPERIIERMAMGDGGGASYDSGYYNIGVRPTEDDLGRGGNDPFGYPLSFTKRALLNQTAPLPFANPTSLCGDGKTACAVDRMAIDGTFKTPTLRNVELTGPYFHNGGQATLMQVVDFYTRGGDFHEHNIANLDSDVDLIDGMTDTGKSQIVDFLMALTDERVRWEKAPFDHPELIVPNGSPGNGTATKCLPSNPCDETIRLPPVGAAGRASQGLAPLGTYLDLNPHLH